MSVKQKLLTFMKEEAYKPLTTEELREEFNIPAEEKDRFLTVLEEMEAKGLIIKNRKQRYGVPERMNLVVGRLQGHPKGFGFLIPDDSEIEDIYVSFNDMNGAMHGDRVVVRPLSGGRGEHKRSGEVIRILDRANQEIVGNYEDSQNFGFVVPDDRKISHDVFIPKSESKGAQEGQKVVVEISRWPEKRRNPEGKVKEILGYKNDPGVDIEGIVRKLDLPEQFPAKVKQEVKQLPETIPQKEIDRRQDLRDLKMMTIDGEDAKDFDDAVSLEKLSEEEVRLGVHIADVTYYVDEGSSLDQEALERGTSIYLVDRVIPMLPEKLSNDLCSLIAGEDKLAVSVLMDFELATGELQDYEIRESVIDINHRLTYTEVNKMLEEEASEVIADYKDVIEELKLMNVLAQNLREQRIKRGSIDFDFPEIDVILDELGKPIDVVERERGEGERLIEDFMIRTNEVVAQEMYYRDVPFIYRVHESPSVEDLQELNEFLHNFGYHIKGLGEDIHPKALQTVLNKVEAEPEEKVVNTVLLRTMQQAHYSPENSGHFGLASECYTHFTSPIRRYPDLMIHRIIKEVINKGVLTDDRRENLEQRLEPIAEQSSVQERKAMEAELETKDLKKVEYMQDKIGEQYNGIISSVKPFGFFVELENSIEGLVHVSTMLDDYYHYQEDQHAFIGERTGKIYQIGDEVEVEVSETNLEEKQIDLELVMD